MPTTPTVTGPTSMKIHKKTGENTYILYHPQTGAEMVLYNGDSSDPDFSSLTKYNAKGEAWSSGAVYYKLSDVLSVIFNDLGKISNVLEFKGVKATYAELGTASASTVGDVWVVNEAHGTYPAGTLYVGATDGNSSPTYSWEPLGGNNTIYALKTEAIGSVTQNGATITFGSVSGATIATVSFGSIGTVSAGTSAIVSSITAGTAGGAIPDVDAVRSYAGSAGKIDTVAEGNDGTSYYLVGAAVSGASTGQEAISSDIKITHHTNGPDLISGAKVADLIISQGGVNMTYDGSDSRIVSLSNGFTGNVTTGAVTVSVKAGDGITVNGDGVKVKPSTGIAVSSSGVAIAGAHTISAGAGITVSGGASYQGTATTTTVGLSTTGIAAGVYSALSVDAYGRASAGAQSLVFAENINDPDLNSLVVGGLAFVGNEASYTDSANTTHSGTINPIG